MNKIKTKTSLERQLPEFIREEYTAFVDFVKAYYEFLEQTQSRNLEDVRSIDRTLDEFVDHFRREVASLLPTTGLQNERFFLEKVREFYNIRGSVESYKLLFRLLYNKDVEVFYPSTQILRASDGKWIQEKSVFVRNTSGNVFNFKGQIINITTDKKILSVYSPNVIYYRDDVYEVFIDKQYYTDISIGDTVSFNGNTGEIIPCPATYKIVNEGSGFEIGAIYNLPTASGKGSTIKITGVGGNGEIKRIQVISFGLDYDTNFFAKLSNKSRQALAFYNPITLYPDSIGVPSNEDIESNPNAYLDGTSDYIDLGYFINQDYMYLDENYVPINYVAPETPIDGDILETEWYADTTYVGTIIASFYTNEGGVVVDNNTAEIKITLGPVAVYPGYYATNDGFVSDESFIQDGEYYQLFSYTLKVTEQLDSYKDIVKSLLHPSGLKLFGEFNIKADFEVQASPLLAFIRRQFVDYISQVYDDAPVKYFDKVSSEIINLFNEAVVKVVNKEGINSDINAILDTNIAKNVSKLLEWDYVPANVNPEDEEAYKQYATISHSSDTDVKYMSPVYSELLTNANLVEAQIKDSNKTTIDNIIPAQFFNNNISKSLEWDYVPANVDPEDEEAYKQYAIISHNSNTDVKVFNKNHNDPIIISYDDLLNIAKSAEKIIPNTDSIVSITHNASDFINRFITSKSDNTSISDPNKLTFSLSSVAGGSFYQTVTFEQAEFSREVSYNRAIADIQYTLDVISFTGSFGRSFTDNQNSSDFLSRQVSYNRSFIDSQNSLDTPLVSTGYNRSFDDLFPTAADNNINTPTKRLSETVTNADSTTKSPSKSISDSTSTRDSFGPKLIGRAPTDNINNQDTGILYNNPYNTSVYTLGETDYFSQTYAEVTTTNF